MTQEGFSGEPKTVWLTEPGPDRRMRLLENFCYRDAAGRVWPAPQASVIDGATIPRALWTTVGSPYTGDYRRASIVHDVACVTPGVDRREADRMFYEACRFDGCSSVQAKLLYLGVRIGGWFGRAFPFSTLELDAPTPRLPGEYTAAELALRAKFTLVAIELMASSDDFERTEAIVDARLS